MRNPTTASIAVRPCLSSASRYVLRRSSGPLEKPIGSKKPRGALAPTMSAATMERDEVAGFATLATLEPTKEALGTNAEALQQSQDSRLWFWSHRGKGAGIQQT